MLVVPTLDSLARSQPQKGSESEIHLSCPREDAMHYSDAEQVDVDLQIGALLVRVFVVRLLHRQQCLHPRQRSGDWRLRRHDDRQIVAAAKVDHSCPSFEIDLGILGSNKRMSARIKCNSHKDSVHYVPRNPHLQSHHHLDPCSDYWRH